MDFGSKVPGPEKRESRNSVSLSRRIATKSVGSSLKGQFIRCGTMLDAKTWDPKLENDPYEVYTWKKRLSAHGLEIP